MVELAGTRVRTVMRQLASAFLKLNYLQVASLSSCQDTVLSCLQENRPLHVLAKFCLSALLTVNHFMVFNITSAEDGRVIVTEPNGLTNKVIGQVLYETAKRSVYGIHGKVPLVYAHKELNEMIQDLPLGITVGMVLEALGLAIPVTIGQNNNILPATSHCSDLYLLGLVDVPMPPKVKRACQHSSQALRPAFQVLENQKTHFTLLRSVSRLFALQSMQYSFIPGYFLKLFMFVYNQSSCPERCWYWKDGMVMKSIIRLKISHVSGQQLTVDSLITRNLTSTCVL